MDLENINSNKFINNYIKICEFCGKELDPIGLDYLYANTSPECIEYERCNCDKAQDYWKEFDEKEYKKKKQIQFRKIINEIYKQNYVGKRYQNMNFENFNIESNNEHAVNVAKDFVSKNSNTINSSGLIIMGKSGTGKTHIAAAIANKLIENNRIVLIGRLTMLLDMIKETFRDNTKSENDLIELYSNVDMVLIDDLGTEKISSWALEKLYTIIQNRSENGLPIIITTRFNKEGLMERFSYSKDTELVQATINKLYQMCYGITLKSTKKELV